MSESEEQGLLQAIRQQPDDDAHRMVYADWLGENGDGDRANFIRFQCWAEEANATPANRDKWLADAAALLARHRQEWEQPLRDLGATEVEFHRGFPCHITIPAAAFLDHAGEIFERAPIQSLRLTNLTASQVPALASSAHLANLTTLDLGYNYIGDADAAALADSPHLAGLTALNLGYNRIGNAGAVALANSPHLANLTALDLAGNAGLPQTMLDHVEQVLAIRRQQQK